MPRKPTGSVTAPSATSRVRVLRRRASASERAPTKGSMATSQTLGSSTTSAPNAGATPSVSVR